MKWLASAPANIALIKYMGKQSPENNLPANASLSYTLENLRSYVELEQHPDLTQDTWQPLHHPEATYIPVLDNTAQQRYLNHLIYIKQQFNYQGHFIIRSANNFPAGCGIASSASSFAALTLASVHALTDLTALSDSDFSDSNPSEGWRVGGFPATRSLRAWQGAAATGPRATDLRDETKEKIANLSRHGSGSSCRSLFSPWALWQDQTVKEIKLPYQSLHHHVIIISDQHKTISSSEAHKRVTTSLLYDNRPQRAEQRLKELLNALNQQNWQTAHTIIWQEFWDMHALFETAAQPFNYIQPDTLTVLDYLRTYWQKNNDGPFITLDAGPNVHLLFKPEQTTIIKEITTTLAQQFKIL